MSSLSTMTPPVPVTGLSPITLDDLNEAAGLQTRVDRKYILDGTQMAGLVDGLAYRFAALDIGGRRSFAYESVYFDTPDKQCYRAAAHKRRHRFKVRTRTYLDSQATMLEVKTRGLRQVTVKERQNHCFDARTMLERRARAFVDATTGISGVGATLRPVLTTHYERTTLADLDDVARLTIDSGLRCSDGTGRAVGIPNYYILETKSTGSPSVADRWLWSNGIRPTRISKFGTGLAALDPSLRANKWHRTLRRYFTTVE